MEVLGKDVTDTISYQEFRKFACFMPSWQVRVMLGQGGEGASFGGKQRKLSGGIRGEAGTTARVCQHDLLMYLLLLHTSHRTLCLPA